MIILYILPLAVVSWTFVEIDMLIKFPFSSSCIDMTTSEYFLRIFLVSVPKCTGSFSKLLGPRFGNRETRLDSMESPLSGLSFE